jgi:serine/threonine protein kinase
MPRVKTIGKYEIEDELGSGTFGVVYRANDPVLDRKVAIKELKEEWSENETVVSFFQKEAQLLARVDHPNIAKVFDYITVKKRIYIIMEFCPNGDLQDVLNTKGNLDVGLTARLATEIFLGLQAAHENGVVHRDLKPANVLLGQNNACKVTDFGLAGDTSRDSRGTRMFGGTPGYWPPEQDSEFWEEFYPGMKPTPTDERSDVFAAGTLLWQMLTNQRPPGFQYVSDPRLPSSMPITFELPDARQVNPDIPDSWINTIARCREILPDNRIQTMGGLIESLGLAEIKQTPDHRGAPQRERPAPKNEVRTNTPFKRPFKAQEKGAVDEKGRRITSENPIRQKVNLPDTGLNQNFGRGLKEDPNKPAHKTPSGANLKEEVADEQAGGYDVAATSDRPVPYTDKGPDSFVAGRIYSVAGRGLKGRSGDGGPSRTSALNFPTDVLLKPSGDVYIADFGNHKIRVINPRSKAIDTLVGRYGSGISGDGSICEEARLNGPSKLALHPDGSLYIADSNNRRIRRIDSQTRVISTVVGTGDLSRWDEPVPASNAGIGKPTSLAISPTGTVYFCETSESTCNTIIAYEGPDAPLRIVAGLHDQKGFNGEHGSATESMLDGPTDIAVNGDGAIFIADSRNYRIRKVDPATGSITTFAGTGIPGYSGDGGQAVAACLGTIKKISIDPMGNLWMIDDGASGSTGSRIRKVDSSTNVITTEIGGGLQPSSDGALIEDVYFSASALAIHGTDKVYLADATQHRVWQADVSDDQLGPTKSSALDT